MEKIEYLQKSYFYLNLIQIMYLWLNIKSEAFIRCTFAYNKLYIWFLNAHVFNVLLFKLFFALWDTGRHKKIPTLQIDIFNVMKGKKNAKVHLIKIMKVPVKIFPDQGDSSNFKSAVPKILCIQGGNGFP